MKAIGIDFKLCQEPTFDDNVLFFSLSQWLFSEYE